MRHLFTCGASLILASVLASPADVVKRSDALTVLRKMDLTACEVLRIPYQSPTHAVPADTKPVMRTEIVDFYHQLFLKAKAKFKFAPVLIKGDMTRISLTGLDKSKASELVQWGFVPPVAPLLTSKRADITVQQFGDSVGYFMARLAELTHKPSARYSPQLVGGHAPPPGSDKSKKGSKSK